MRFIIALCASLLLAESAIAQNQEQATIVYVLVDLSAGGITINHEYAYDGGVIVGRGDGVAESQAACTRADGVFTSRSDGAFCSFPIPARNRTQIVRFNGVQEAEVSCTAARGVFTSRGGRLACANPQRPLLSSRQ